MVDRRTAPQRWAAVGVACAGLAAHGALADLLVTASAADVAASLAGNGSLAALRAQLEAEARAEFRAYILPQLSDQERAALYRQAPELFEGPRVEV